MNRHQLQALARGAVSVLAGCAILYVIGRYLGWWVVVLIAGVSVIEFARYARSLVCW